MLLILLVVFLASPAFAVTYCKWSGTAGTDCQSISNRTYIWLSKNHPIAVDPASLAENGFYELVETEPTIGADQKRGVVQWNFTGSQIEKTWLVEDMTATEIDERDSKAMPLSEYLIWKLLVNKNVVTVQELRTFLETNYPEIIDAYQGRDRLENP
jgi:hypothetical protein